jgi:hypothetical protein
MAEPAPQPAPAPQPSAGSGLAQAWREAMEANARYYEAWGQLASQWVRELAQASQNARMPTLPPLRLNTGSGAVSPVRPAGTSSSPTAVPAGAASPAPAVLVLEGPTGAAASAAFLVENTLSHPVVGSVEVEPFEDIDGVAVLVRLEFEPETISLAPGERRLVRVSVTLPTTLPPDIDCRSTIRVDGVPGTTIPVVLRRLGG